MEALDCTYSRTIYQTEQNGVSIALYDTDTDSVVITGVMLPVIKKMHYTMKGNWVNHPKYGKQFKMVEYEIQKPTGVEEMLDYLSSGIIKGIGKVTAERIVSRFGNDTMRILDEDIERLLEVKGITRKKLETIRESCAGTYATREVVMTLNRYNIGQRNAQKVCEKYGLDALDIIRNTPYELCSIPGISFLAADAMGNNSVEYETDYNRFKACARYVLFENENGTLKHLIGDRVSGSLSMEVDDFGKAMLKLLRKKTIDGSFILQSTIRMIKEKELKCLKRDGKQYIYLPGIFRIEEQMADDIIRLYHHGEMKLNINLELLIDEAQHVLNISLCERQKDAVRNAFRYYVSLIIGPPGTGKTTVLKVIAYINKRLYGQMDMVFLAPTGKAASRITESSGYLASTVHSNFNLGTNVVNDLEDIEDMLENSLVFIDEMSMVDARTAYRMFARIGDGCRVVLSGDDEQLQSVGAGAVLRDMIDSEALPTTVLDTLYRQGKGSVIPENSMKIRDGRTDIVFNEDFQIVEEDTAEGMELKLIEIYLEKIKQYGRENVMLLSPFREHHAGVVPLNEKIQNILNPAHNKRKEFVYGNKVFRIGDLVMNLKNGNEVSNGDTGVVMNIVITDEEKKLVAEFPTGSKEYTAENIDELALSYAYTVHKSQGSEAKCVITCMHSMHSVMLKRNLFYTAITRAKEEVIVVGQKAAIERAIRTVDKEKRNTSLRILLQLKKNGFNMC